MTIYTAAKRTFTTLLTTAVLCLSLTLPANAQTYSCGTYGAGAYGKCTSTARSGGGSFETADSGEKIVLNDYEDYLSGDGKDLALKVGQVVYFLVEVNGVLEEHSATIKEIGADYVIITFASTPKDVRIEVRQTVNVDVTDDNEPDITVKLTGILNDVAYLTFRKYTAAAQPIPDKQLPESEQAETPSSSFWKYVSIGIGLLLVLAAIVWAIKTKRRGSGGNDIIHP